ncbi:MAG: SPOR domain-containing protein [Treponema sp.]|nr:SPOR domain-containing protein [Treponema sp.]
MKKLVFFLISTMIFSALTAQTAINTAQLVAKEAAKKDTLNDAVAYLKKQVPSLTVAAEKRAGYAFLGGVQEQMGLYADAQKSYVTAAGIAAGDAAGMPKKSNEQLVLDAVRCALSCGDSAAADSYLNSAVRGSKTESIQAYVKLYEQWSALCKVQTESGLSEPVAMLKTYAELPSMKMVAPAVLLTLWHVSGEQGYADKLKKNYPNSPETAVVKGAIQQLPHPFWYFVPRIGSAIPEVEQEPVTYQQSPDEKPETKTASSTPATQSAPSKSKTEKSAEPEKQEKPLYQQLGLFRDEGNAKSLVEQLKKKGFAARITSEKRPSGTTYYIVVVDENKDGTMGNELRNAGFECYGVY